MKFGDGPVGIQRTLGFELTSIWNIREVITHLPLAPSRTVGTRFSVKNATRFRYQMRVLTSIGWRKGMSARAHCIRHRLPLQTGYIW